MVVPVRERLLWFWPYRQRLVSLVMSYGEGHADAEDIASLAVERAATANGVDERAGSLWPYVAKVATNLMRDRRRRVVMEEIANRSARLIPRHGDFEGQVVDRDLGFQALKRLQTVEDPMTVALVLRRLDGLNWSELGDEFGVTASAAQSRARRALVRLARWIERRHPAEDLA